MDISEEAFFNL